MIAGGPNILTARTNRIDLLSALLTDRDLHAQGDFRVVQRSEHTARHWRDKKIINFLSTADKASAETTVQRKQCSVERLDIQCPLAISECNRYMNSVDHADHLRTLYLTYCTSRKWWKYIYSCLLFRYNEFKLHESGEVTGTPRDITNGDDFDILTPQKENDLQNSVMYTFILKVLGFTDMNRCSVYKSMKNVLTKIQNFRKKKGTLKYLFSS